MLLKDLLKSTKKKYQKIPVKGICFDSRNVKKNDIFFAIKGKKTSGIKFIEDVIKKKASIIVSNKNISLHNNNIPVLIKKDVRKSLAEACSNFYKKKPLNIIAVTGTNGKSSVAEFFYQLLNFNKIPVASIGTLGIFSKKYNKKTNLTSVDPLSLHKNLQILAKHKINNVILEASSHGLQQRRLDHLNIKTGIFTNLSHDHLDYHKNIKSYFNSKMHLFKNLLNKSSNIITDQQNKEFKNIKNIAKTRKIKMSTIGLSKGSIKILSNSYKGEKQIVKVSIKSKIFFLEIPLIGFFQVKNLLMAILATFNCGLSKNKIFKQLHKIKPVPGRLECVGKLKNKSIVVIDFAHTPDALKQSLYALRKQFKRKIVIVFGCGGDRDKKKRILMGKIAQKFCRKIFVTDDNPRNENPKKIRQAIINGCKKNSVNIANRKLAIKAAIKELRSNEILVVAGKGHENKQIYKKKIVKFSDKQVIRKEISKENFLYKKSDWPSFLAKQVFNKNKFKNLPYSGVSINTKTIKKNNLFFAIKGKNNDGHDFAFEAIKKGAIRSVISRRVDNISINKSIRVENTYSSLVNLAKLTRKNTDAKIIGITGSVGKTTLKNLITFSLKNYGKVQSSPFSYNNKYGVPLSIANIKRNTEYGVFEIGMDKRGEILNLSNIVKPEIGIITNISEAHFKNFRTLKDIAKAKAEIIDNILEGGQIILNKDDKFYNFLSKKAKKNKLNITSFSFKKNSDIFLSSVKKIKNYYQLKINVKNNLFDFNVSQNTNNFISNILACISALSVLNIDLKSMKFSLINFNIPNGRGDIKLVKKFKKRFKFY